MITIEELEKQLSEAKKGKAKVDSKYVGNADGLNHVFEYKYDYPKFLENISYTIQKAKERENLNINNKLDNIIIQ